MRARSTPQRTKLPSGWVICRISDLIAGLEAGVSVNSDDVAAANGEPGVLKVSSVSEGRFIASENKRILPSERARVTVTPKQGRIIISRSNTSLLVGENAYMHADYPDLFLSDKLWQTIPRPEGGVEMLWLSQLLQSSWVRRELVRLATGTSGSMKNISQPAFLGLEVLTPRTSEQRKIARILGTWHRAIERLQALLKAKTARLSGLRKELLAGTRRFMDSKRHRWRQVRLNGILEHVFRPVPWTPDTVFRLVSIRRRGGGLFSRKTLKGADYKTRDLHELEAGDFLVSKRQVSHGAWGMVSEAFAGCHVSKEYSILVNRRPEVLDMAFFDWLCRSPRMWHLAFLASDGVHREKLIFDSADFLRHSIELPPTIEEQRRIVRVLNACECEIRLLESELEALKQQKRGLMQKLLTGEVHVHAGPK